MGGMEVCKVQDPNHPYPSNLSFEFTITPEGGGTPIVYSGIQHCTPYVPLPAGNYIVSEAAVSGVGVSAITATSGVAPNQQNQLLDSSLANRTALVRVLAGDVSQQTLVTFTNASVPNGWIEICKWSTQTAPVTGNFQFRVSGIADPVSVPVNACSFPIEVQAGSVTVEELASPGSELVSVTTNPADRLLSVDLPTATAVVHVPAGDLSTQTRVNFTNQAVNGRLKICKVAGPGVEAGSNWHFRVDAPNTQPALYTVPAGQCVLDGIFPIGTPVTVTETDIPANISTSVVVAPAGREIAGSNTGASVQFTTGSGYTEVVFTNQVQQTPPQGYIKVCKVGGAGVQAGTMYTIAVNGMNIQVPAGSCVPVHQSFNVGSVVTLDELVPSGGVVTDIHVMPGDRLVAGSVDLGAGTIQVTVGEGVTEVFFTNTQPPQVETGMLRVCKVAGTGITAGMNFTFSIGGATQILAANGACYEVELPVSTPTAIQETLQPTFRVSSIVVNPEGNISVAPNLTAGTVSVVVTANATTTVTYTNQAQQVYGCSPGYFKNHLGALVGAGLSLNSTLGHIFPSLMGTALGNTLISDALGWGGGPTLLDAKRVFLRQAVAAYLNIANGVNYSISMADLQTMVSAVMASNDRSYVLARAALLDSYNNFGCNLSYPNTTSQSNRK